jgi:hypothetical protein
MTLHWRLIWVLLGSAVVVAMLGTPFLLHWAAPDGFNWAELSDISQTYTAISVPLTAAALLGAVISLTYQARQSRVGHEEATSAVLRDLVWHCIDDPDLALVWGPPVPHKLTPLQLKQYTYANMIVSFWHSDYLLGGWRMTDEALAGLSAQFFRGQVGREFWALAGAGWRVGAVRERRSRRFLEILNRSYETAVSAGPAVPASDFFLTNQTG